MLAEAKGPDGLPSVRPWKALSSAIDGKQDPVVQPKQHDREHKQRGSGQKSCCFFGLETWTELVWEDWDLGKEFTKTLVLKNVQNKLQKLHSRPPVSKFFSVMLPQTLVVSPGTSLSIPVTFTPLKRCEYEDSLEFHCKDGSFQISLRAIIPCHALEVPDSVTLPLCAVQHSTHASFVLKNASKLHTYFQWECLGPFQLSPEQGLLRPNQECPITVLFQPQEALVYQQQAYCSFGEEADKIESSCTVLLQATAKYPYLQFLNPNSKAEEKYDPQVLNFGSVAVGQCLRRHFEIYNPSLVPASFSLSRLPGGTSLFGSEFSCDVTKGEVGPGRSLRATVTFAPAAVGSVSVEYLSLRCGGALSEPRLRLTGSCTGPEVSLSSSVVDFGCIGEGGWVEQTVKLVNSAAAEAVYRWDIDCAGNSVFSILPASGAVPPHSHTTLKAVYRPTQPTAHHRRVACLILHKNPVFVDLIGTCHSELQKPVILKPEHLVLYKLHWPRRQGSPHTQDHSMNVDQQGLCSPVRENKGSDGSAGMSAMEEFYRSSVGCVDSSLSSLPVSVLPAELLFNHKAATSVSTQAASSQSVSITNHTRGRLSLMWTVSNDSPFSISPSSCDLAPLKSTSFRVMYDPREPNSLHGAQLECFAYYKDHLDGRLLCPPWCVTVRAIGHSFQPGKQHFVARCSVTPPKVVFPGLGVVSYQTVLLKNDGELPLTFCLDHRSNPALAESIFVVPSCGLIQPGAHQIIVLRTTPTEDSPAQGSSLKLQLNGTNFFKELPVVSVVEKPCVSLDGGATLYFQPTAVGSRTERTHHIRNLSRLPIRFQWSVPEPDQGLICVAPHAGELHPNEIAYQTWSFSPLERRTYTLRPALYFWPSQSDGSNKSHLPLTVVGMGADGCIEAEKAVQDVGEILIGSCQPVEVPLVNNSPCAVSFSLSVQQKVLDDECIHESKAEPHALDLDCERGTVASHSTMQLRCTVRPNRRAQYSWTISYQTTNASGFALSPPQTLCEVRAKGVFPTLQVMDGYCSGSMSLLSKVHLWKLFSLHSLNEHLLSNPSYAEFSFKTSSRHSLSISPVFTQTMLDFNFSSAPVHSQPATVVLMFHNPGSIPVDWAFLFPEDQQIELEYWAVTGEFSSTELYQMKVQDNQLFSISPRSGTLLPGQKRAVHFSYSHDFTGTDRFPVVLKLSYGREILINFQGVTVERDRPYLHFASSRHTFTSVTIGDCCPPKQVYELHNGGAVPVHYEVDTDVLSQLQTDNFNHPVLYCLSPEGNVLPGKMAMLEWVFSPLEAKLYQMDVPIRIHGGDSKLVRFEGWGLDAPSLAPSDSATHSDSRSAAAKVQRVPFPGQVLFLSEDSVLLGNIPVNSRASRILFLTNVSRTDTLYFQWDLPEQMDQQVVQIQPGRGRLCPGDCSLCVLTFTSADYPTVYQLDLLCQVFLEGALVTYQEDLQRWEEEKERQQDDFTITDKQNKESQRILIDQERLAPPSRKGPPLRKYKTLPPICASASYETMGNICSKLTRAERRLQRETAKAWWRPKPPQATLLHLEVAARSHELVHYLEHFPDQFNISPQSNETPTALSTTTHGPDKDTLSQIFTSLLRDILDDSSFIQLLNTSLSKPDIYKPTEASSPCFPSSSCPATNSTSSPPPANQPQPPLRVTAGRDETTGASGVKLQTQDGRRIERAPSDICEDVLMNTLQNLMMEAVRGELVFTAHPYTSPPEAEGCSKP